MSGGRDAWSLFSTPKRPRGYFHEDESIDQLYRISELQEHTIGMLIVLATLAFGVAIVALVVASA